MRAAILLHTLRAVHSQWWSSKKIAASQERALVRTMRHACTHVPFYRALGIAPTSIASAADLQRFPLIHKADLQADSRRFIADNLDTARLRSSRTSGSTGEPTVTWFDDNSWALCKYALKIRRILAITSPFGRRCLIVNEQPPAQTESYGRERPFGAGFGYRERLVSLFEDLDVHRRVIAEFRPDMLYAFPSYFLELARSYREAGAPAPPRIPILFTSSEVLTPAVRRTIESAFGGQVFDLYGSTEFKEVAWECRRGGAHLNFESVYAEIVSGAVVLTTLCNRAMPLLRFQTGDLGSLEHAPCPCGRQSPQLHVEMGREGDVLELPGGRRLSPYTLTTLIEALPGMHQYRIVHEAPTRLLIEIAASPAVPAALLEECRMQLAAILQEPVDVSFAHVTHFKRRAGGKHKVYLRRW